MMKIQLRLVGILSVWLVCQFGSMAAHAQDRECFLCNVAISEATITGPSSVQAGDVHSWTASARWSFDYDLLPGETIDFSAKALTFQEFTPPDDYHDASVTPYTKIICEPDCKGHGSIIVSFTATGAFEPPLGNTTQNIYLIPQAELTSSTDPFIDNLYDMPIAVPAITISILPAPVPEPTSVAMLMCGLGAIWSRARQRARRR
jgi:hypothetical protein